MPLFGLVQARPWFRSSMWISSVAGISKVLCTPEVAYLISESVRHSAAWHRLLVVLYPRERRVDTEIDNKALYFSWCNQGGRIVALNRAVKELFFTTVELNILLQQPFIPTNENPADAPSKRLLTLDSMLNPRLWGRVQSEFGGPGGHTCDLMALDSNVMKGFYGRSLPHFTPRPSPESSGVNVLAQSLSGEVTFLDSPYVFPPPPPPGISWPCLTPSGTPSQILHDGNFRLIPKEILVASDPEVLY